MKDNNGKIGEASSNKKRKERGDKIAKEVIKELNSNGIRLMTRADKDLVIKYIFLVFSGDITIQEAIDLISEIMVLRDAKTKSKVERYNNFVP